MIRLNKKGEVVESKLPKSGIINGRLVSGYDRLPKKVLLKEGWVEEKKKKK